MREVVDGEVVRVPIVLCDRGGPDVCPGRIREGGQWDWAEVVLIVFEGVEDFPLLGGEAVEGQAVSQSARLRDQAWVLETR